MRQCLALLDGKFSRCVQSVEVLVIFIAGDGELVRHLLDIYWTPTAPVGGHPYRVRAGRARRRQVRGWSNRRVRGERRESVGGWHMGDCSTCVRVCQMSEL